MHIIVLENEPTSFRGGQEFSLFDICWGLFQRGHIISLLYIKEGNLLKQYQEFCTHVLKVNSYEIASTRRITSISKYLTDIYSINRQIPIRKNSIVYSNQFQDTLFGSALALLKHIPFVCHLRLPAPVRLRDFRCQHILGLKGVNKFITVSNQTKYDWIKSGIKEKNLEIVYNGINTEVFKPLKKFSTIRNKWNICEETRVILYVGRLDTHKRVETLIRAFALLLKSGVSIRLLIAGKYLLQQLKSDEKTLQQLSIDLGIEKYVNFPGHVTDTVSLYQVSDVTVLPSLWAEPFGRTIIESMACRTPVVASRIGGIPEILTGEFQIGLFEPGNERELSDSLNRIMNWRQKNPQLGARCREHALYRFSLDRMIANVEKVLLQVAKQ